MHKSPILLLLLSIASVLDVNAQTATIDAKVVFLTGKDSSSHIHFTVNRQVFGEKDTLIQIRINRAAWDTCEAIIGEDTLRFLTKFKKGETYEIKKGCCCSTFILEAKKNPRRGTVTLKNTTDQDIGLVVAEANRDTVKASRSQTTFAYESAMCLFKPCNICITDLRYFSNKYVYENDNRNYDALWQEQAQYVLSTSLFHFLHGEKINIVYNEKTKSLQLKLSGYLSRKEYEKWNKK